MAEVRPFAAYRPKKGLEDSIAALPYDVYNRQEAAEAVQGKPYTFLRIDRPETQFPPEQDMYSPEVYQKAKEMLYDMIKEGSYVHEDKNVYYIYELIMDGRHQTGIVAAASIDDYQNGVIMKHENTRADKEADRINHVYTCNAQTGPIFLAYRNRAAVTQIVNKVKQGEALYSFTSEDDIATIEVKNRLKLGDTLEIIVPNEITTIDFRISKLWDSQTGEELEFVNPGKAGQTVKMKLPIKCDSNWIIRRKK